MAIVLVRCGPPGGVIILFVVSHALALDPTTTIIVTLIYRRDVGRKTGLRVAMHVETGLPCSVL